MINRDISFEYEGQRRTCVASIRFMMGLDRDLNELSGSRLMAVLQRMETAVLAAQNDPKSLAAADFPVFEISFVIGEVIRASGCAVDDDQVYDDVMEDMASGGKFMSAIIERLYQVISPPKPHGDAGKNLPAPQAGAKKRAKPARK